MASYAFADFDLTCTVVDSYVVLSEMGNLTAPKFDQNQPENQILRMSSTELRNTWTLLSKQYTEEYGQCIASILSIEKAENFDYEGLCKALDLLSDFEKKANDRVVHVNQRWYAFPWWRETEINSKVKKSEGLCLLTPEDASMVLQALGLDNNMHIYIAAGEIYGSESIMKVTIKKVEPTQTTCTYKMVPFFKMVVVIFCKVFYRRKIWMSIYMSCHNVGVEI